MKIDFIDLKTQQNRIRESVERRIQKVLDHGSYVLGPEVKELEESLARYVGRKYCVSCGNGTDALLMALMAYDVKPGEAIFVPPFTFVATAEVVALVGATPVFVDIDERSYNLDPTSLERAITEFSSKKSGLRPRGIIPVDLFGQPAEYDAIASIAKKHDLFVLEDAAQGFGARYKGKRTCGFGDIAATSFFPAKPLGCYGDGGAIFTDDPVIDQKLRSIRVHGQGTDKYDNVRIGINGRLDTIQAAVLLAKMEIFDEELAMRDKVARRYTESLNHAMVTPHVSPDCTSCWAQYSVLTDHRDAILAALKAKNIPSAIYYPKPLHLQDAFGYLGHRKGDFPVSERIAARVFSIPMHPYLDRATQDYIIEVINEAAASLTNTP
jgi:UDP-2-acetamido-2-deoxy-ribo-hexuluronate aminotransferase